LLIIIVSFDQFIYVINAIYLIATIARSSPINLSNTFVLSINDRVNTIKYEILLSSDHSIIIVNAIFFDTSILAIVVFLRYISVSIMTPLVLHCSHSWLPCPRNVSEKLRLPGSIVAIQHLPASRAALPCTRRTRGTGTSET